MSIEEDIKKIEEKTNYIDSMQEQASKDIKELQTKIKNGETTGNFITDFCIKEFGIAYKIYSKKIQNIYSNLKKHNNEIVLVEKKITETYNPGLPGVEYLQHIVSPIHIHKFTELEVGLIKEPYISFDKDKSSILWYLFKITTENKSLSFASTFYLPSKLKWEKTEEDIKIKLNEFFNPIKFVYKPSFRDTKELESFEILVGDSKVKQYFYGKEKEVEGFYKLEKLVKNK